MDPNWRSLRVTISTRNGPQDLKVELLLEMSDENTEGPNDWLALGISVKGILMFFCLLSCRGLGV